MPLPDETLQRLARLGYTSEHHIRFWQDVLDREGESFLEFALRRSEEDADEYARALPLLQSFAADCRRAHPARPVESFSPKERE